jgi:hypothetical protein
VVSLAVSVGCDGGPQAPEPEPVEPASTPPAEPGAARAPEVAAAEPEPVPVPVVPCGGSAGSDLPGVYIEILGPCRISLSEDGPLPEDLTELEREQLAIGSVDHMIRYRVVVEDGAPSELIPALPHADTRASLEIGGIDAQERGGEPQEKRYFACDEPGPSGLVVHAKFAGVSVDTAIAAAPRSDVASCDPMGPELYTCKDREPNALARGVHEHRFVFNGRAKKVHQNGASWSKPFRFGEYPLVVRANGVREVDGEWVPFHLHASATVHVGE